MDKILDKWFGTAALKVACIVFQLIERETGENPSYSQVEEVLDCIRDLAKEKCVIIDTQNLF